ncbi:zinc-binding alcohol dehydrogenase family protein [Phanerochaete sordida]|uniref:Zinc-binding alcohol dehydrogenase family protein n=1 Tax=Phanerochaete sordida TaxID=48140 RepID=A0A9P3GN73_9APHY|nr:zinc-binding alcohol dehydrogenase family protein [Phanerochaete sordida]
MSTKQKSLVIPQQFGTLAVQDTDIPVPAAGELLVRVEAAALNPVDWKIQVYGDVAVPMAYPGVLGTDGSGVVVRVGEGVTSLAVGDRVLFQSSYTKRSATFQHYCVVPADLAAKIPSNLSFDEAATIPLACFTAAASLYNDKQPGNGGAGLLPPWKEGGRNKYAGQPIVVIGGASSVGQYAIQFAKLSGFSPIIATASLHNEAYVKSLGASHVIDRNAVLQDAVLEILKEAPKFVFDAIGDPDIQLMGYELVAPGGTLIDALPCMIDQSKLQSDKEYVFIIAGPFMPHAHALGVSFYQHLTQLFESGDLKPSKPEVLPDGLTGVIAGLEKLKNGKVSGVKLVAHPQETQ